MRLIDADKLTEDDFGEECMQVIHTQPTAYDVDAVLEMIENVRNDESIRYADQVVDTCIQAIKAGGKNG